jgi:hypothetical protein
MVSTQHHTAPVKSLGIGDTPHKLSEGTWGHPGVSAKLIDLVTGRFDQGECAVIVGLPDGSLDDKRVG